MEQDNCRCQCADRLLRTGFPAHRRFAPFRRANGPGTAAHYDARAWLVEVYCTLNRLAAIDRRFVPPIFSGSMQLPLELIHTDDSFISRYGNVRIPYIKGGDHIYLVIAHVNVYRLVTRDAKMREIAESLAVNVRTPTEYLAELQS